MELTYTRISEPSTVIKYDDLEVQDVQIFSRYKNLKRVYNEDEKCFIETPNKLKIRETTEDTFYKVEPGFENRLDLVSYKFYGTPKLWWAIAYVNRINNPRKVEPGIILRIPVRSNIVGGYD